MENLKIAVEYLGKKSNVHSFNFDDTAKAMANKNVYPNCVLIILSSCYIRFIIIFQIFNFVLAFSTFSVAFLFCLLQTSFWKNSRKAF